MPALFPVGTEAGNDTRASPEIWTDRGGFEKAAADVAAAASALSGAAASGDRVGFRAAFRATSLACASCHYAYRSGFD